jgi:hypothetical protein
MPENDRHWSDTYEIAGQSTPEGPPLRLLLLNGDEAVVVDLVRHLASQPQPLARLESEWFEVDSHHSDDLRRRLTEVRQESLVTVSPANNASRPGSSEWSRRSTVGARLATREMVDSDQQALVETLENERNAATIASAIAALRRRRETLHVVIHWSDHFARSTVLRSLWKWHSTVQLDSNSLASFPRMRRPLLGPEDRITCVLETADTPPSLEHFRSWGERVGRFDPILIRTTRQLRRAVPMPPSVQEIVHPASVAGRKQIQHGDADLVLISGSTPLEHLPRDMWLRRSRCVILEGRGSRTLDHVRRAGSLGAARALFLSDAGSPHLWQLFAPHPRFSEIVTCARRVFDELSERGRDTALSESRRLLTAALLGISEPDKDRLLAHVGRDPELEDLVPDLWKVC